MHCGWGECRVTDGLEPMEVYYPVHSDHAGPADWMAITLQVCALHRNKFEQAIQRERYSIGTRLDSDNASESAPPRSDLAEGPDRQT